MRDPLVTARSAAQVDAEASASWGLNAFALVEAAGRLCAQALCGRFPDLLALPNLRICAVVGSGNNGADALVALRALILEGHITAGNALALTSGLPQEGEQSPRSAALQALGSLGVRILLWETPSASPLGTESVTIGYAAAAALLKTMDCILDGIAGTGLRLPLAGPQREMVELLSELTNGDMRGQKKPIIVSIDMPSGLTDGWQPDMPLVRAQATLAIEPLKLALYTPAARTYCGEIVPIRSLFPRSLMVHHADAELLCWEDLSRELPPLEGDSYKYSRGVVAIHAGSPGSAGAARIAAQGAQAAGGGLVRLILDQELYPILAGSSGGIMVLARDSAEVRFQPDALLLGPGWGKGSERIPVMDEAGRLEREGIPLVLDADAIWLSQERRYSGSAIMTPHPGEFAALTGIPKERVLANPIPFLTEAAQQWGAVFCYKGHVLYIVAPDGRVGILDGMAPALATGGTGDLLAGFCVAIAARMKNLPQGFDGYVAAALAASLLLACARGEQHFLDPLDLGKKAAGIAGKAWLA